MKKQLLTLIALCSLCFVGCNSTHANKKNLVEDDNISLEVTLERNMSSPYPLDIIYKLTNLSDKTVYYNYSRGVLENSIPQSLFSVQEDGIPLAYQGPNLYHIVYDFDALAPGETYSTFVSLDKGYKLTKGTHNYMISYKAKIQAKTSDNKREVSFPEETGKPVQPDELAPKDHTSKTVQLQSNTLEFEATINQIREPY